MNQRRPQIGTPYVGACTSGDILGVDVVAATPGQDETNLVITNLARFVFNVRRVIARVNNPKNAWIFTAMMGIDVAVNQADLMASLIAKESVTK